jgi:hypothetical protein
MTGWKNTYLIYMSQQKSAKQCAELIMFVFTSVIYGLFKDADGNSYNQEI